MDRSIHLEIAKAIVASEPLFLDKALYCIFQLNVIFSVVAMTFVNLHSFYLSTLAWSKTFWGSSTPSPLNFALVHSWRIHSRRVFKGVCFWYSRVCSRLSLSYLKFPSPRFSSSCLS